MTRNCLKENTLNAFLDQSLSAFRMSKVSSHLQVCESCRRKLSDLTGQYERMDEMIRSLPEIQPSPGFDAGFWRKVAELEQERARPKRLEYLFNRWRFALAAAVTAGLVTAFIILSSNYATHSAEEMFIADHMEMLNELDLIERLDLLENWEAIQTMKEEG